MSCKTCCDRGFYLSRRCRERVCAHPKGPRPMDCPERPCKCDSGSPHRKELRARIRRQQIVHDSPYMTSKEQKALFSKDDP
jgi:hypothetical protein